MSGGLSTEAWVGVGLVVFFGVVTGILVPICLFVLGYCLSKKPEELPRPVPPKIIAQPQDQQDDVELCEASACTWQRPLVIDQVEKAHEGNYRRVVSFHAENIEDDIKELKAMSNPANLTVGDINEAEDAPPEPRRRVGTDESKLQDQPARRQAAEGRGRGFPAGRGNVLGPPGPQPGGATPRPKPEDNPTLEMLRRFPDITGKLINVFERIGCNYKEFGTFLLGDDYGKLVNNLADTKGKDPYKISETIVERWLDGHGMEPTYGNLVSCLEMAELNVAADDIRKAVHLEDRPTLTALKTLQIEGKRKPIDVILMISASYKDVGIFLLDDENGLVVDCIEGLGHDPVAICKKIIHKWQITQGGKATWKALVEHLHSAQLNVLADDIEKGLQRK